MTQTALEARSLDDWYREVNSIYLDRNFYRDEFSLFGHLVEVVGGLSLIASQKTKPGVDPFTFVPKAIAWWLALCGRIGIRSVEELIWTKFPAVCPYCLLPEHRRRQCKDPRRPTAGPNWQRLAEIAQGNAARRPKTLDQWQAMFSTIYQETSEEDESRIFGRFAEELGELAEALRALPLAPGYFLSEAADVFAWLMHLQNLLDSRAGDQPSLSAVFAAAYPDVCSDCSSDLCVCPPILEATLGRIGHEVPSDGGAHIRSNLFTLGEAQQRFGGRKRLRVGDASIRLDELASQLSDLLRRFDAMMREDDDFRGGAFADAVAHLETLTEGQRLTQNAIDQLTRAVEQLSPNGRRKLLSFLESVAGSTTATALLTAVNATIR